MPKYSFKNNLFFQYKNHVRTIKIFIFFPDFGQLGGWVVWSDQIWKIPYFFN